MSLESIITDSGAPVYGGPLARERFPGLAASLIHVREAFMIEIAKRYDVKVKKYINTPYKIYFEDIGLRNARLNFRQYEPSQSAYAVPDSEKMIQETRPFLNAKDSFKKILLLGNDAKPRYDDNGILVMGVKNFLLDIKSLEK